MTFEVEVCGRIRMVTIDRTDRPGTVRVTVDGAARLVDASRGAGGIISLLIRRAPAVAEGPARRPAGETPTAPGASSSFELQLSEVAGPGELLATLGGRTTMVRVNGRRGGRAAETGAQGHGEAAISAPMPGRVVRVLVETGQDVAARQGIVVVEAMKMENELRAPRAGRVKELRVAPGVSVEAGRILAVIE